MATATNLDEQLPCGNTYTLLSFQELETPCIYSQCVGSSDWMALEALRFPEASLAG